MTAADEGLRYSGSNTLRDGSRNRMFEVKRITDAIYINLI